MAIGFPARHDRGSLNCRPGNSCCGSSNSMVMVVDAALVGIINQARCTAAFPPVALVTYRIMLG